ncbi:MAG: protein-glutamate O-methyltransferase CheR [Terrimicrobiaceae bacterium]
MKPAPPETAGPPDDFIRASSGVLGLDLFRFEEAFLRKAIAGRLLANEMPSLPEYADFLAESPEEAEEFFRSLHVNHSSFFRNPLTFAVIEQLVLPGLVEAKKKSGGEIRVWSAGCASGQEAWSIAMLLEELTSPQGERVSWRIFATDLAEPDQARVGVYCAGDVGNVRARHLRDYFFRQADSYVIVPGLRSQVDFSVHDLLDDSSASPAAGIFGDFDLILCCNVLIYYRADARQSILEKLWHAISPGGFFVTGEAERTIVSGHQGLRAVAPPAAVFQTDSRWL